MDLEWSIGTMEYKSLEWIKVESKIKNYFLQVSVSIFCFIFALRSLFRFSFFLSDFPYLLPSHTFLLPILPFIPFMKDMNLNLFDVSTRVAMEQVMPCSGK